MGYFPLLIYNNFIITMRKRNSLFHNNMCLEIGSPKDTTTDQERKEAKIKIKNFLHDRSLGEKAPKRGGWDLISKKIGFKFSLLI
jgi:hypothetical protein